MPNQWREMRDLTFVPIYTREISGRWSPIDGGMEIDEAFHHNWRRKSIMAWKRSWRDGRRDRSRVEKKEIGVVDWKGRSGEVEWRRVDSWREEDEKCM